MSVESALVEVGDVPWALAVVVWETGEEDQADGPEQDGDGHAYGGHDRGRHETAVAGGRGYDFRAPVEECRNVDALCALDYAGAVDPGLDWCAACINKLATCGNMLVVQ